MYNPYVILNIKENATIEEIDEAYIRKLKEYNQNENAKDKNGNYEIQKLKQAHDDLINEDNRKRIDEGLKNNREDYSLIPTDKTKNKQSRNVYINNEYVNTKITLNKKNIFSSKIKISKVYAVLTEDDYFTFTEEYTKKPIASAIHVSGLFDMFLLEYVTKVKYSEYESSPYLPWHYPDKIIDTARHVSAITYPATKFVPFELIDRNGCVYKDDLRTITLYVNEYLRHHKGEVKEEIKKKSNEAYSGYTKTKDTEKSKVMANFKIVNSIKQQ